MSKFLDGANVDSTTKNSSTKVSNVYPKYPTVEVEATVKRYIGQDIKSNGKKYNLYSCEFIHPIKNIVCSKVGQETISPDKPNKVYCEVGDKVTLQMKQVPDKDNPLETRILCEIFKFTSTPDSELNDLF